MECYSFLSRGTSDIRLQHILMIVPQHILIIVSTLFLQVSNICEESFLSVGPRQFDARICLPQRCRQRLNRGDKIRMPLQAESAPQREVARASLKAHSAMPRAYLAKASAWFKWAQKSQWKPQGLSQCLDSCRKESFWTTWKRLHQVSGSPWIGMAESRCLNRANMLTRSASAKAFGPRSTHRNGSGLTTP